MKNVFIDIKFLKELIGISILVLILHTFALLFFLYWTIGWFDILMHFLGGATMGFLAVYIFFTSGYIKPIARLKNNQIVLFLLIVFFTLIIGLVWELWEVFVQFTDLIKDGPDTILDLIMDFIGAVSVYFYVKGRI